MENYQDVVSESLVFFYPIISYPLGRVLTGRAYQEDTILSTHPTNGEESCG